MQKILILCSVLMMSSSVFAQETPAETCADGAGVVIIGDITGHKYCRSKTALNWWNAYAWCDAIGMQMVDALDCKCSELTADCANKQCPEFTSQSDTTWTGWTTKTNETAGEMYTIAKGKLEPSNYGHFKRSHSSWVSALCK
ncbi:MAG: hypothetical protein IJV75_01440 [Alphaproteobacteria bacterium]|nr:hypothetical protein [Alphaproteobacteria bacterium]